MLLSAFVAVLQVQASRAAFALVVRVGHAAGAVNTQTSTDVCAEKPSSAR